MTRPVVARDDEAGFRTACPRTISGFTVLEVRHFKAGSVEGGSYGTAVGLTTRTLAEGVEWATHIVVHQAELDQWVLWWGNYFGDEASARADLEIRRAP